MRRPACVAVVVGLAAAAGAVAPPTTEQLLKDFVRIAGEASAVLDGITDRAGAEKAKPRLEALSAEFDTLTAALKAKPQDEVRAAVKALAAAAPGPTFLESYDRLVARVPAAAGVLGSVGLFKKWTEYRQDSRAALATLTARSLTQAVQAYCLRTQQWPESLAVLVKEAPGRPPLVLGGEKALIDPWGQPYQFLVVMDGTGGGQPYVWTERVVDGKTVVYGEKPPAGKKP